MLRVRLKFRRRRDSTVYLFDPCADRHGYRAWKRLDLDLWLARVPAVGWRVIDANGSVLAVPEDAVEDPGDAPPLGRWRSRKAGRSYEYDLSTDASADR